MRLNHLIGMMEEVNANVITSGEIVPYPFANPVGTTHQPNGYVAGRHAFEGGSNFNRNWFDLTVSVAKHLDKQAWE